MRVRCRGFIKFYLKYYYYIVVKLFFILGNFIFYFLSNLIFCKFLYGHLICARGAYVWVGCVEVVIELRISVGQFGEVNV